MILQVIRHSEDYAVKLLYYADMTLHLKDTVCAILCVGMRGIDV